MHLSVRRIAAVSAVLGALFAGSAGQASAATRIAHPTGYSCGNARVSIPPARIWANQGRTEQVAWVIALQRWNGSRWASYTQRTYWASFNHFGQNVSRFGWILYGSTAGGGLVNSRINVPVRHRGYYRVASSVSAPGLGSAVFVGGSRNYCWMP